jgi:hypothetical protein
MKKQTAVEKAIDLINKDFEENGRLRFAYVQKVLNEAKEMERQTKLRNQLFTGKVIEIIGFDKTIEIQRECFKFYPIL